MATAQQLYGKYKTFDTVITKMDEALKSTRQRRSEAAKALLEANGKGPLLVDGQPMHVYSRGNTYFLSAPRGRKVQVQSEEKPGLKKTLPVGSGPEKKLEPLTEGLLILSEFLITGRGMAAREDVLYVPAAAPAKIPGEQVKRLDELGWTYTPSQKHWQYATTRILKKTK